MCGIAGILGRSDRKRLAHMLDAQRHRGPDGRRIWTAGDGSFTLGHDRLAIVDVAGGTQPLANEDGTLWLAMNGEIYNHLELRRELEGRHTFRTRSDSEVVLHLFEEEGPDCVRRLDGMFALAIWGAEAGLLLARDPLGIKPLYFGYDQAGTLGFASEIRPLLDTVCQVRSLPNGSYWQVGRPMVRYYEVPRPVSALSDEHEAVDRLQQTLVRAVRKRLMADVPLGVFLSGGLDSSLIAAIVRRQTHGELHSFSVGLEGSADLENARRVAADLGTVHHERVLTPTEVVAALPHVIDGLESCDPALVRSAVPTYFVSELASRYVKVVLSGEGADELFAGYHYLSQFADGGLSEELRAITRLLHNANLQRVDRMTMAHGLEGRVPFLDKAMVDLAFQMDPELKWRDGEGKWVLRKVAERYLAPAVVWRTKEKFAVGTGIGPVLENHARTVVSQTDLAGAVGPSGRPFASAEEYLYWTLFADRYGREDVLAEMGRSRSLNPGQVWVSSV